MPARWAEVGAAEGDRGHSRIDVVPMTMGAAGLGLVGLTAGTRLLVVWLAAPDPDGAVLVRAPLVVLVLTLYGLVAGALGGAAASWSAHRWARGRRPASLPLLAAGTGSAAPPLLVPMDHLAAPVLYLTMFSGVWLTAHLLLDRAARRRAVRWQ